MANFNGSTPAAPGSAQNVLFAYSGTNVSAYMPTMIGDTGSGGKSGAAPAPASGDAAAGKYLKADGTWTTPPTSSGATGPQGATGPTGPAGAAATVTVGTTTTGAAGSSASVTNSGSTSAAVLNFTIPQGATGATGPQGATGATGAAGTSVQAYSAVANQFINAISAAGAASSAQPSFSNLTGTATAAQMATLLGTANTWTATQTHSSPISITYAGSVSSAISITAGTGSPGAMRITTTADSVNSLALIGPSGSGNLLFNSSGVNYALQNSAGSIALNTGLILKRATKTAAYTLTTLDYAISADATSAAFTLSLLASPVDGQYYEVTKVDATANIVTISGNGKNINGVTTKTLSTQWTTARLQYDATLGGWIAK